MSCFQEPLPYLVDTVYLLREIMETKADSSEEDDDEENLEGEATPAHPRDEQHWGLGTVTASTHRQLLISAT